MLVQEIQEDHFGDGLNTDKLFKLALSAEAQLSELFFLLSFIFFNAALRYIQVIAYSVDENSSWDSNPRPQKLILLALIT